MKPIDFIAKNGIDFFTSHIGEKITVRLLSDDEFVFTGFFTEITPEGENLPLIDGVLIELPQFNLHMKYEDPVEGKIVPINFNIILIDDMKDIIFNK
ncbi:MAG: hypothetical protein J5490_05185 [Bacteroidales bacterium]|nr:hypothetical protein [Bacteroidales bacterium]